MKKTDLHVHTNQSDGTYSPAEVVKLAKDAGLSAIAITDHDTHLGYREAVRAGEELGLEVVPGIEISTKFHASVHILGYFIDVNCESLQSLLDWIIQDRASRNGKMAALMAADGLPISYDRMIERFGKVIGRPHFGRLLIELGLAKDMNDAFDRFIEKGQKYYLPRNILPIGRAIEIIREAGGVPVLAHPFQYRLDDAGLRELIECCISHGLQGMECYYSGYSAEQSAYLTALAKEYGLLVTGGSDFHGKNKTHISLGSGIGGTLEVPYDLIAPLKARADENKKILLGERK